MPNIFFSSIQFVTIHLTISLSYVSHVCPRTNLNCDNYYYWKKRWKKKFVYPFRGSVPRSALPPRFPLAIGGKEKEGNCWQNDDSNGSYGPLVRFNGISPSRAKIWVAGATRARACDFACREANHYETRFSNFSPNHYNKVLP